MVWTIKQDRQGRPRHTHPTGQSQAALSEVLFALAFKGITDRLMPAPFGWLKRKTQVFIEHRGGTRAAHTRLSAGGPRSRARGRMVN
jgi:hypothetical protein